MDNVLLQACVSEARRELAGLPVHRLVPHGPDSMTLLLGGGRGESDPASPRRRLHLSILAGLPRFHVSARRSGRSSTPTPFQALLGREIEASRLVGLAKETWERVVRLDLCLDRTADPLERHLVVEYLGARPNLVLLDDKGRILGHARPLGGARNHRVGTPWVPPPPGDRLDPAALGETELRGLAPPAGAGLARVLGRRLRGQSPVLLGELERRARAGEDPWDLFRELHRRILAGAWEPCLYVPAEWARILRRHEVPEAIEADVRPLVSPLPVDAPAGTVEMRYAGPGEAMDDYGALGLARMEFQARRDSLAVVLQRERSRLERLVARLQDDLARAVPEEDLQRRGEVLLAGLADAEVDGDRVTLPDPYDATGARVTLAVDPRLSLPENAQRLFHRARKARRGRETVGRRLEELGVRLPRLQAAQADVQAAVSVGALEALEGALAAQGLVRLVRRQRPRRAAPRPGSAPEVLPVRSYLSVDGMEILVGRTGKENDLVTFRLAAPQDFWFHAQGFAGAHVVVRNPGRLGRLPQGTARQAAMLAAFHSKARGSKRVEVMMTQRRQVRKARNQPPGQVLVRRHETLQVPPEMPFRDQGGG